MRETGRNPERARWLWRAVTVSIAGYIFSVALSCLILCLNLIQFEPVEAIERTGIDLSMQMLPWRMDPPSQGQSRYVFVDADPKACQAFLSADICGAEETIPVELVSAFVAKASSAEASVIVIDTLPNNPTRRLAFFTALRTASSDPKSPWIIAPYSPFPTNDSQPGSDTANFSQFETPAGSRLRLASTATASDPGSHDDVIRSYPLLTRVTDGGNATASRWIPTVPTLAALIGSESPNVVAATDCYFYYVGCAKKSPLPPELASVVKLGQNKNLNSRIFYTLPALSQHPEPTYRDGIYTGSYERYLASDLLDPNFDMETLKGRIVVLGSSFPQADDMHMTPIGPMSGAEIVINAIRSIQEFSVIGEHRGGEHDPQLLSEFLRRVVTATFGVPWFFAAWLLIFWLHAKPAVSVFRVTGRYIFTILAFFTAFCLAFFADLSRELSHLRAEAAVGVATDMLTPLVALGLEGFAEAAKVVTRAIEGTLERLVDSFKALQKKIAPTTSLDRFGEE